jgi:hypothetical protein
LNDYGTLVGIALPTKNWVGEDYHVIQFWQETYEPIQTMEHPAAEMYIWLISRMHERAQSQFLPIGMPETFTNLSIRAYRTGKAGYILYEPLDSLSGELIEMPVRVEIEYDYSYTKLGMGESHTQRMLAAEFWALMHNARNMFPEPSFARDIDGKIRHHVSNDSDKFHNSLSVDQMDTTVAGR